MTEPKTTRCSPLLCGSRMGEKLTRRIYFTLIMERVVKDDGGLKHSTRQPKMSDVIFNFILAICVSGHCIEYRDSGRRRR